MDVANSSNMEETPAELNPRKGRSLLLFEEGLSKQEKNDECAARHEIENELSELDLTC